MALPTIDNDALVQSLFETIRCHGYEGSTLALLSEATGLKKSSLYHRFPAGKDDMVKAVILYVSAQLHQLIVEPLRNNDDTPEQRFNRLLDMINAFYGDGKKNCLLNVLSLGEATADIKAMLEQDYRAWLTALTQLAMDAGIDSQEAEARSEHFLVAVQGALVIQRLTADADFFAKQMAYQQEQFFRR